MGSALTPRFPQYNHQVTLSLKPSTKVLRGHTLGTFQTSLKLQIASIQTCITTRHLPFSCSKFAHKGIVRTRLASDSSGGKHNPESWRKITFWIPQLDNTFIIWVCFLFVICTNNIESHVSVKISADEANAHTRTVKPARLAPHISGCLEQRFF